MRRLGDAIRWPFERLAWALERGLLWPLEERTDKLGPTVRVAAVTALALLAAGAGALGLVMASGGGGEPVGARAELAPAPTAAAAPAVELAPTRAAPVLQGAKPHFGPEAGGGTAGDSAATTKADVTAGANSTAEVASSRSGEAPAGAKVALPGPTALQVVRRFAGAFVLYEIGSDRSRVREVFEATATPRVAHSLLQRQPRQPAGTKVPKAKVLNVVPGPHHGDSYTLSVSLLRVGATSELRLDVERDEKTGEWQVTEVLG